MKLDTALFNTQLQNVGVPSHGCKMLQSFRLENGPIPSYDIGYGQKNQANLCYQYLSMTKSTFLSPPQLYLQFLFAPG